MVSVREVSCCRERRECRPTRATTRAHCGSQRTVSRGAAYAANVMNLRNCQAFYITGKMSMTQAGKSDTKAIVAAIECSELQLPFAGTAAIPFLEPHVYTAITPPRVASPRPAPTSSPAWERLIRRTADVLIALTALLVLFPLMITIAIAIKATSDGPALFKQPRVGRDRQLFTCYKFRTMRADCDDSLLRELVGRQLRGEDTCTSGSWKVVDDDRVTPIGAILRRTSLDELPQLLNVLLGSMSAVGPRPMLDWQVEEFPREFDQRYCVRPGITGLWQVSGRSRVSTLDMLRLDVRYVTQRSLASDFMILVRTIPVVLRGDGAR